MNVKNRTAIIGALHLAGVPLSMQIATLASIEFAAHHWTNDATIRYGTETRDLIVAPALEK